MDENHDDTPPDSALLYGTLEERTRQQLLDVLGDPVRRRVLYDLGADEQEVALSDLAERVASDRVRGATSALPNSCAGGTSDVSDVGDDSATGDTAPSGDGGPTDDGSVTEGDSATERVAIQLHHVHLPMLDDYGLVEYDRGEKTVNPAVHQ